MVSCLLRFHWIHRIFEDNYIMCLLVTFVHLVLMSYSLWNWRSHMNYCDTTSVLLFCASDIVELNTRNLYKNLTTYATDEVAWRCCMTSQFQIILGLRGGLLSNGQWAISYSSFDLILRFSAVCFVSVFFSQETNSDLLCVDEKFQSQASAGQWPIHFKCTILALVLVSGTDEKTHGALFYWNITDYIWYLWKCKTS